MEQVKLSNYNLISRRDRDDGRQHGGIALFAKSDIADAITKILRSETAERLWLLLYTSHGPVLFCIWYRPPNSGEMATIRSLFDG